MAKRKILKYLITILVFCVFIYGCGDKNNYHEPDVLDEIQMEYHRDTLDDA